VLGDAAPAGEPVQAGAMLTASAFLLGYLVAEIFGNLTRPVADTGLLYQAHVRTVMLGMGYRRALIEQAANGET
jgi:hypothetical protein